MTCHFREITTHRVAVVVVVPRSAFTLTLPSYVPTVRTPYWTGSNNGVFIKQTYHIETRKLFTIRYQINHRNPFFMEFLYHRETELL